MTLDRLLRHFRPAVLGLALTVSPVYALNCGGEENSKACVSDTECHGDNRICVDGKCEYGGNGAGGEGEGEEGPCGNSPLNGKYLLDFGNCQTGSVSPGDPASCTFEYTNATDIGVPDLTAARIYKYQGDTIHFGMEGINDYTLSREFSCSSVHPEDQSLCSSFQCVFQKDLGFYVLIPLPPNDNGPLRLKSNLLKISTTSIWELGKDYCPYGDPVVRDCFSNGEL